MYQFILLFHVFAAICIIVLVLVQQGKGATMGAAFGSGASQTVFGSRGSGSFLFRITMSLVLVFFMTSLAMNYMTARSMKQEKVMILQNKQAPAKTLPTQLPLTTMPSQNSIPNLPASNDKNKQ